MDRLLMKLNYSKEDWHDESTMIQEKNKRTLLDFGLNHLDLWTHDVIFTERVLFTDDFAVVVKLWWKFGFTVTPILAISSLQNLAYAVTTQLPCHVQNFVMIISLELGWKQNEIFN